ncbi:MAG: hypothetical protein MOGDAGHF_01160 [Rhodocyclaceae bacterium]|nr:hypothetical protein [Rhodocyclaceae bacterium]
MPLPATSLYQMPRTAAAVRRQVWVSTASSMWILLPAFWAISSPRLSPSSIARPNMAAVSEPLLASITFFRSAGSLS